MQFNFISRRIDFIQILVLHLQLNSCVNLDLQRASRFCVGKAQKMTILTPYIMVMECEQTMLE
jgi:hypothetical protein